MRKKILVAGALLILAFASASCSFTTANISDLKISKDREGKMTADTFGPNETVYARATVSNVPGKVTLKFRLVAEKVEGQPENEPVPQLDNSLELEGDGFGTYDLSPPTMGWPAGKYRVEVSMLIENGEQKDKETATFTVAR